MLFTHCSGPIVFSFCSSTYLDMLDLLRVSFWSLFLSPVFFILSVFHSGWFLLTCIPYNQFYLSNMYLTKIKNSISLKKYNKNWAVWDLSDFLCCFYGFLFPAKFFKLGFYFLKQSKVVVLMISFSQFSYLCLWLFLMVFTHGVFSIHVFVCWM